MAPHSSTLTWKISWMEEPGGLQSMGSRTERLHFHFSLSCTGEGNGNPLQCSCLENPRDGGAWWAAVYGVAQSRIRLKRLSSSSRYKGKTILHCISFQHFWSWRDLIVVGLALSKTRFFLTANEQWTKTSHTHTHTHSTSRCSGFLTGVHTQHQTTPFPGNHYFYKTDH